MLQSLRDNLKGTVAVIIIAIFAVPMVLFGVERLFVGSLGGNDVATVDGTSVTRAELSRAIFMQKQRILSESDIDPNSDFLKDENLREPVLRSLTRQAALLNAAKKRNMAVSDKALWEEVARQPQFQTDGSFDRQRFRQFVTNLGYTPSTYLEALADGVILNQLNEGISSSSFLTEAEVQQFVAIAQQTRDFFTITVPEAQVKESISVSDDEIADYYAANQDKFAVPERVALNYIEVDLDTLAARQDIDEADVRAEYEQEVATFNAEPQYEVAHILIEESDDAAERLAEAQAALASGRDFAEVAREFSDDLGTRDEGGTLGRMIADAYPEPFVEAVNGLEEGEISEPVETEAGIHLIKVDEKTVPEIPSFADRKDAIEERLRRALAEQKLAGLRERLDELTYNASDLQEAAAELDLEIKSTPLFARSGGTTGLTGQRAVQEAAFSKEVLEEGHNSAVLELPDNRLVVIRVTEHEPKRTRPLAEVEDDVKADLVAKKTADALVDIAAEIRAEISQGADAAEIAKARGYSYEEKAEVSRSDSGVDRQLLRRLFSMPLPQGETPALETVPLSGGDYVVVGLTGVEPGSADTMPEAQLAAMRAQLTGQGGDFEARIYENHIVSTADIKID